MKGRDIFRGVAKSPQLVRDSSCFDTYSTWRTHSADNMSVDPMRESLPTTRTADECPPLSSTVVVGSGDGGTQLGPRLPTVALGFILRVVFDAST